MLRLVTSLLGAIYDRVIPRARTIP